MLAIRMQRTGRKGYAQYRVVIQDSHRSPTSGRVVAHIGSYNPHTKKAELKKDRAEFYLKNGAQPSERVARLLKSEGVALPDWVKLSEPKARTLRNPQKLRKNQPKEEAPTEPVETAATEEVVAEASAEVAEETTEVVAEAAAETPADDKADA